MSCPKTAAMRDIWTSKQRNLWAPVASVSHSNLQSLRRSLTSVRFCELGYVFEAIDPHTGESVAIKRTSKSGEYVSREFEVLDRLRGCENVVQLLNIYYSRNEEQKVVQNLVFEFCHQNLEEVI